MFGSERKDIIFKLDFSLFKKVLKKFSIQQFFYAFEKKEKNRKQKDLSHIQFFYSGQCIFKKKTVISKKHFIKFGHDQCFSRASNSLLQKLSDNVKKSLFLHYDISKMSEEKKIPKNDKKFLLTKTLT